MLQTTGQSQDPSKNAIAMEGHIFKKSRTKDEYLGLVAKLCVHFKDFAQSMCNCVAILININWNISREATTTSTSIQCGYAASKYDARPFKCFAEFGESGKS